MCSKQCRDENGFKEPLTKILHGIFSVKKLRIELIRPVQFFSYINVRRLIYKRVWVSHNVGVSPAATFTLRRRPDQIPRRVLGPVPERLFESLAPPLGNKTRLEQCRLQRVHYGQRSHSHELHQVAHLVGIHRVAGQRRTLRSRLPRRKRMVSDTGSKQHYYFLSIMIIFNIIIIGPISDHG